MSKLEKGQTVLIRDDDFMYWMKGIYKRKSKNTELPFICTPYGRNVYCNWEHCIPYLGNEDLEGTTNMPKEKIVF